MKRENALSRLTSEVSFLRTRYSVRVRKKKRRTSEFIRFVRFKTVFVANPVPWRKLEINKEVYICIIYIYIYKYKDIFLKARTGFARQKAIEYSAEVDFLRWRVTNKIRNAEDNKWFIQSRAVNTTGLPCTTRGQDCRADMKWNLFIPLVRHDRDTERECIVKSLNWIDRFKKRCVRYGKKCKILHFTSAWRWLVTVWRS